MVSIKGPKNTPYENGIFYITFNIKKSYPSEKLSVKFLTKIWHPNINEYSGEIDLKYITKDGFTINNIGKIISGIFHLMANPNFSNPLNNKVKYQDYEIIAKKYTKEYADKPQFYNLNYYCDNDHITVFIVTSTNNKTIELNIRLSETIVSAKERYYKIVNSSENSQWIHDAVVLRDDRIFGDYCVDNYDYIEVHPASLGGKYA